MIDWTQITTSKPDCMAIARIACRAQSCGIERGRVSLIMDIELAHHACPMDLDGLHNAEELDLVHDVSGIVEHLNRDTGELERGFTPRYTKR